MDARREYRLPIIIPVSIRNKEKLIGHFTTRDISIRGVSISNITSETLLTGGDLVYLNFKSEQDNYLKNYSIKARVVYKDNSRIGLLWADYDPNLFYFLQEMESVVEAQSSIKKQEKSIYYC